MMIMDNDKDTLEFLSKIINARQSIYPGCFTGEIVDDALVHQILENANQSPSHRHTEPWRFHLVSGMAKARFAQFMQECYKERYTGEDFNAMKHEKIARKVKASSHIIILGMQRDPNASVPEWEEVAAVACAVQNIYLSVTAASLGGYWSTPGYFIDRAGEFLDLKKEERCLGLFYLGKPKEDLPPKIRKRALEEKLSVYKI